MESKVKKIDDKIKKSSTNDKGKKSEGKIVLDKKNITEVKASARFIKISPRKVRLVVDQIRGLEADKALDSLRFVNKVSTRPIIKLLNSAVANAENNFKLDRKDLYIKSIVANDGPILKRWQPRAQGRSTPIRKRSSHINIILGVKKGAERKTESQKYSKKDELVKIISPEEVRKSSRKKDGHGPDDRGKGEKGFLKSMFQRKTG